MNKQQPLDEEYRDSLIDLITWYRDEYHRADWAHSEMIEQVKAAVTLDDVAGIEQTLDGWLDGPPNADHYE